MKFKYEAEDSFVGFIVGIVLIGLSGILFTMPKLDKVYGFIFAASFLFTIFDVIASVKDMVGHWMLIILGFINNAIDTFIEVSLAAHYLGIDIFFLRFTEPFLTSSTYLLGTGIFIIVSSLFWLMFIPIVVGGPQNVKL